MVLGLDHSIVGALINGKSGACSGEVPVWQTIQRLDQCLRLDLQLLPGVNGLPENRGTGQWPARTCRDHWPLRHHVRRAEQLPLRRFDLRWWLDSVSRVSCEFFSCSF